MTIPSFSDIKVWQDLKKSHLEQAIQDTDLCLALFAHLLSISEFGAHETQILRLLKLLARRSWDGEFQVEIRTGQVLGRAIITLTRVSGGIAELIRRFEGEVSFLEFKRAALDPQSIAPLIQIPMTEKHVLRFIAPRGRSLIPPNPKRQLQKDLAPETPRVQIEVPSAALPSARSHAEPDTTPSIDDIDAWWDS